MKFILRLEEFIKRVESFFLFLLVFFVLGVTFLQVILRNFFKAGILWADDISRHLVLWIAMLGASYATSEGKHINIELLPRFFPQRYKYFISSLRFQRPVLQLAYASLPFMLVYIVPLIVITYYPDLSLFLVRFYHGH